MFQLISAVVWWLTVTVVTLITTVTLVTSVVFWLSSRFTFMKHYRDIPTVPTRPVLSYWEWLMRAYSQKSVRAFILRIMEGACILYARDNITMLWVGTRPVVIFCKPKTVEVLLNNSRTISKATEYRFLQPWLGTGLLTSNGDKWRSHRKLLTPTFHFQILENFMTTFNEEAEVLARKLESEVEKPWIDIVPRITMCTLDIICLTAMGVHLNVQSGRCKDYVKRIDEISEIFFYRVFRPWLWPDFIFNYCSSTGWKFRKNVQAIHDFTRKVIKEKKESLLRENVEGMSEGSAASGKPRKKAFLELLLELHLKDSSFTEENIREEVDTFMFEGHDTTAMAMSWTLYELGRHPDVQDKVYRELQGIFEGDERRRVTTEDLKRMKYLECTIKETLRLYPSVAFIGRRLTENLKLDSYTLPAGCACFVCIFMLHKDPEQFPQPEVFDPDRFLPENSCKRHPYAYVPFSAGPRNCIGQRFALMEEKTVLAHILRKFKVVSLDPRDRIELLAGLILKNADPIRIRFELRETAVAGNSCA